MLSKRGYGSMEKWPEHSIRGYLTRLPTDKLEQILDARYSRSANTLLQPADYEWIEQLLRNRPDSRLYTQE